MSFCCITFADDKLADRVSVFLYHLASFVKVFGLRTTTSTIPGEVFSTRYRSTGHGISSGKLGAVITQVGFAHLRNIHGTNAFVGHILEIFVFFRPTGAFSTLLIPETKGKTLEELSNENQEGFIQGPAVNRASPHANA